MVKRAKLISKMMICKTPTRSLGRRVGDVKSNTEYFLML